MATVSDILNHALRLNRQRNVSTERLDEALTAFNVMLKSWGKSMHTPVKEDLTLTAGTEAYTIGSGGDFDTTRPIAIVSAYIRSSDGTDYEVSITMSSVTYDRLDDKDAEGRPTALYYDSQFSSGLGKIYFNSAPEEAETFQLTSIKPITAYTATTDTITQPVEYEKVMAYNLAVDLAPEYGMKLEPTVIQQAIILKNEIENRNAKITVSDLDTALLRT